jgi:protein-S-isoprenylcysteine O-methyltransferase Ste14
MGKVADSFFDTFQIVALAVFLFTFTARSVHLRFRKHISPITLNLSKKGYLGLVEFGLFVAVNLWAAAVLLHALPLDVQRLPCFFRFQLLDSLPAKIAGAAMTALAFVIGGLAVIALGDSWRLGLDDQNPGRLVTTGIYAVSRNPIYLFFDLYFIGTFLINGTLVFLIFALFTVANLHYQILQEERFLATLHGTAYVAYRARTTRYFAWHRVAPVLVSHLTKCLSERP